MYGTKRRRPAIGAQRVAVGSAGVVALALLTAGAVAATLTVSSLTVAARTVSGQPAKIVVDGRGVTVYELGGESLAHLECVTTACFNAWPPLKVTSLTAKPKTAPGVPGTVSVMHRVRGGFYQVMLDRHPLYYYSGDAGAKGPTRGQGITSFGGSWHVDKAG